MASDETMQAIVQALLASPNGFANGARSFADQAKWQMGAFGNVPMPAPYDGGRDYPAKNDANAYVRNNYPNPRAFDRSYAIGSIAAVPQAGRPEGWGMQQPQIVERPIQGPYDLMPARALEEQALRDGLFPR